MSKVVIIVKGGCVQEAYATPELDAEIVILDLDNVEEDNGHLPLGDEGRLDIDAVVAKAIEGLVAKETA